MVDLEGVPHVDRLEALVWGGPGHDAALEAMHRHTSEVIERLRREAGVTSVRVSDAHRSGAPFNLSRERLPGDCELCFVDDMYGGPLLEGVTAVACIGMHASARSGGFAGHTVASNTEWLLGEEVLTETSIAQYLAAARGAPMWFTAGDDVLARECGARVPCVVTKHSTATDVTRTIALPSGPWPRNLSVPVVPRAPLVVRFQRAVECDAAVAAGARRIDRTRIVIDEGDFTAQYAEALRVVDAASDRFGAQFRGTLGTPEFAREVAGVMCAPWD